MQKATHKKQKSQPLSSPGKTKIFRPCYQGSDQYKKLSAKFLANSKARRSHLTILFGTKNQKRTLRKHVLEVVFIVEEAGEHTAVKVFMHERNAIICLQLHENSGTYSRRAITSVIANLSIEIKREGAINT